MFFLSLFQYLCLIVVANMIDRKKLKWGKILICLSIGGTIGLLMGMYLKFNAIFIELPLMIGLFVYFTREVWHSTFRVLVAYIILIISDHLTTSLLSFVNNITLEHIQNDTKISVLQVLITGFIGITGAVVLNYQSQKLSLIKLTDENLKYGSILAFLTIVYYYVSVSFSQFSGSSPEIIAFNAISFIVYVIAISFIFIMLINSAKKDNEIRSEKEKHERLQLYSDSLEEMNAEIRKFKHDYINILSTMSSYISEGNMANLDSYFRTKIIPTKDVLLRSTDTVDQLKNMKVIELKGLISYKVIKAQHKGIKVIIEIPELIHQLNMEEIDLCRSIGIILDNAIEEAETQEHGQINLGFIPKEESVVIVIMNTCKDPVNVHKISVAGYSTKGQGRGLGLSNFNEIIEKYDNVMCSSGMKGNCYVQEIEIF